MTGEISPEEAVNIGGEPAHWADQCLRFLMPFVEYLKKVRDTNDMHAGNESLPTAYNVARAFYGDNGTLEWITTKLGRFTDTKLSMACQRGMKR